MNAETHALVWRRLDEHPGAEHCIIAVADDLVTLDGTVVVALDGSPTRVRYRVECDGEWRTRAATIACTEGTRERRCDIAIEGGRWSVDGRYRADLDGCTDVDLEITPATNTLPIRRLRLAVGAQRDIAAAWVRFPSLTVERSAQRYTRLGEQTYRYESAPYRTEITVDSDGLVAHYPDGWGRVATT